MSSSKVSVEEEVRAAKAQVEEESKAAVQDVSSLVRKKTDTKRTLPEGEEPAVKKIKQEA
jgi:hypothetical protein